ncbi:hypothetical protein [Pseudoalteromonas piscicida]
MKNLSALIKITPLLIPFAVVAEPEATDSDLYQLSFEELLNVNVSIATKTDETRASVPSSITVFNSEQINSLGVDNVYDLMNFVPGFSIYSRRLGRSCAKRAYPWCILGYWARVSDD